MMKCQRANPWHEVRTGQAMTLIERPRTRMMTVIVKLCALAALGLIARAKIGNAIAMNERMFLLIVPIS
jgi:hypothetical protein